MGKGDGASQIADDTTTMSFPAKKAEDADLNMKPTVNM